jgi:hypothetical protein
MPMLRTIFFTGFLLVLALIDRNLCLLVGLLSWQFFSWQLAIAHYQLLTVGELRVLNIQYSTINIQYSMFFNFQLIINPGFANCQLPTTY